VNKPSNHRVQGTPDYTYVHFRVGGPARLTQSVK
jgi:hypothetical protein